MRLGIGGGAFGVRGGISTRGVGVGVGPFSAGTSWRGRGSGGGGGLVAWLIVVAIFVFVVAWPYLLGTYIAVQCGAWNPSTERFVVGWLFEVVYIAALIAWFVKARHSSAQRAAEEAHRMAEVIASGAVYEVKNGRSVVYRHGTCSVNHRSKDTAASCKRTSVSATAQMPATSPIADPVAEARAANKQAGLWAASVLVLGLVFGLGILLAEPIRSPAEDASSKPRPAQTSIGETPAAITLPEMIGQNAEVAQTRLKSLGLTSVELSSANPDYKSVWVASNWTVVSTDPAPGCVVNRSNRVVVYVTK